MEPKTKIYDKWDIALAIMIGMSIDTVIRWGISRIPFTVVLQWNS